MRRITLELLRRGPPHNQLLSPLTAYLALCENHSAVSWQVPFEHNQMLYRLRALSYQLGEEPREFQVVDTARVLGELLGSIPGLTSDLNRQDPGDDECDRVTHLRLILSASELALLPFELATAPNGFPGAGQPLSLQSQQPVCITRETRRVPEEFFAWPKKPRVLFVYAAPPGLDPVPAEAHLLALRRSLIPWLALPDDMSDHERSQIVADRLALVPDATVATIEAACATGRYTHVHILAHGVESRAAYDVRYGLALHSTNEPSGRELVSGERLASILRAPKRNERGCFTRPAVVTLASCNSGNVGTITGVGASIGHALHEAGVPMVVASQFPLSFGGSVMMVQDLYDGLLWGEDPRKLLVGLRRRLYARFRETHDWASLTAYATFPPDFDTQLANASIQRAMDSIDNAMHAADRVLPGLSERERSERGATDDASNTKKQIEMLRQALERVAGAKRRLEGVKTSYPRHRARILAQLASVEKREAQLRFHTFGPWTSSVSEKTPDGEEIVEGLEVARGLYWDAYIENRSLPWVLVQYLSLTLLLQEMNRLPKPLNRADQDTMSLWLAAEVQSLHDAEIGDSSARAWSCGNLAELYLLAPLVIGLSQLRPADNFSQRALDAAWRIVALTKASSFAAFSTRRQVLRYVEWFNKLARSFATLTGTAEAMLDALPASAQPDWDY